MSNTKIFIDGAEKQQRGLAYSVLASRLDKSLDTLRAWEVKGEIEPQFVDNAKRRWFTEAYVTFLTGMLARNVPREKWRAKWQKKSGIVTPGTKSAPTQKTVAKKRASSVRPAQPSVSTRGTKKAGTK